jgi:hypothetical protein
VSLTVLSNGSKFAGQGPDSVETLLSLLGREPLDPKFANYGNFVLQDGAEWQVWGNFLNLSHIFDIRGSHAELRLLIEAIRANQQTPAYRAALPKNAV